LVSHNHKDHLESSAIKYIIKKQKKNPPIALVPAGARRVFLRKGLRADYIYPFSQWADASLSPEREFVSRRESRDFALRENNSLRRAKKEDKRRLRFTFLTAKHTSNRGFFDINSAAWGSWMIDYRKKSSSGYTKSFKIYFAGDTGYAEHFKHIGNQFKNINVAILPIGPNDPSDLMTKVQHINTEEAWKAFKDLKARYMIPKHWGTFKLGSDTFDGPIKRLKKIMKKKPIKKYVKRGSKKIKIKTKKKRACILGFGQAAKFEYGVYAKISAGKF
jgi:L-ascorbate metabolism protein UlaG (beta-lactamase superfamily)